ncbi:MAG: class I SAM-dependent methyltransferase [Tissierellaceae bacterium]|nr:class I SAM-dependent methyltransferase [Tissierellaceae bacterium]
MINHVSVHVVAMYREIVNNIKIWKDIVTKCVKPGQIVADCTVGNGNDTLLLCELVGEEGKVYGFDIQREALDITSKKLSLSQKYCQVHLIQDGHENIDKYVNEKLDFIVYNLGYLPKGDKSIRTNKDTTIISLQKAILLLNNNGIILITSYTGHEGGMDEKIAVEKFLKDLDQKLFNVLKYEFINQKNFPPILYAIEKSNNRR